MSQHSNLHPPHLYDVVVCVEGTRVAASKAYSASLSQVLDVFSQFGLEQEEDYRWAICCPQSEGCDAFARLAPVRRKIDSLAAGAAAAQQLGFSEPWGAVPTLLTPTLEPGEEGALRKLATCSRVIVCLSADFGPDGALAKACAECSTDLIDASPYACSSVKPKCHSLARLTGTRLLVLPGLECCPLDARAGGALAALRALRDPGERGRTVRGAGVHQLSFNLETEIDNESIVPQTVSRL